MKYRLGRLVLWYLFYYFFIEGALRDLLISGQTDTFDLTSSIFGITSLVISFFYVLFSYTALYKYYPQKKWIHCILGLLVAMIATIGLRYFIEQILLEYLFQRSNYPPHYGVKNYVIDNYFYGFRYLTFGVIFYFICYSIYEQKRVGELLVSKKNIELALLRSQINPHFLLNSLNNIYSLVYHKSDQALPAMDQLNDILKYTLYEPKDFEYLEKEIEIANKYIQLEKLRTSKDWHYTMETIGDTSSVKVPQHLLAPIIENTVKHGITHLKEYPGKTIITRRKSELLIHSSNKINTFTKDKSKGIGLPNLDRRLDILYEGDYFLSSQEKEGFYTLDITIPIK